MQPEDEVTGEEYEEDELEEGESIEGIDADAGQPAARSAEDEAGSQGEGEYSDEYEEEVEGEITEEEETEEEEVAQDWVGLRTLPERGAVMDLLKELRQQGRKDLTVLLLGKSGVGKSSTVNTLLNEKATAVSAFKLQPDTESTTIVTRQVSLGDPELDGFKLRIVDTCGLEDPEAGDTVNYQALQRIAEDIRGLPIDVVLYCDRLDLYRVDPLDRRIMASITDQFGRGIWKKTVLLLTHGNLTMPPPGTDFDSFTAKRIALLQRAVRGALFRPPLPAALAENGDTCKVDAARARILPDAAPWVPELVGAMVDMALRSPAYLWKRGSARRASSRFKWLIPVVAYAQYVAWKTLLEPRLKKDEDVQAAVDEETWKDKAAERRRLGIGPPLRPTDENAWRLEQMYDDD